MGRPGRLLDDLDPRARLHPLEELDHVGVAHADAAVGGRGAERRLVRGAVDVDEAAHAVDAAEPVAPPLEAAQPQDPGEDPIALGLRAQQLGRAELARRAPPDEDGAARRARPDLRADLVEAARGLLAALLLSASSCVVFERRGGFTNTIVTVP